MARGRRSVALLALICALLLHSIAPASAAPIRPISDAHRSAAAELFAPIDESYGSLEETYEALRTFQILGVEKSAELSHETCLSVAEKVGSSSTPAKDLFYVLRITSILGCQIDASTYDEVASTLHAVLKDANSLLEFYYSIGGLLSIKDQGHDVILSDADGTFHAIKALSQSDGRWRLDTNSAESSTFAAGIALESLAGVISLAGSEVDQSMIGVVKNDIVKLFGSIKSFDDGTLYFDEKHVDGSEYKGPLTTSASVVRGVSAFAAAASGNLNVSQIPGDKILGLAKFFLSIGVPAPLKISLTK
uniref:Dolichyl-diphosphooligosaccharide--protein glycosyltransferase subunit 2 n=1 Tax=Ananas comosus var. bracteatus TaxID=296719 RepID=A0A6V7PBR5_ANACO|nr:unnamed protein product [Ananas comosus var. bracteatus]